MEEIIEVRREWLERLLQLTEEAQKAWEREKELHPMEYYSELRHWRFPSLRGYIESAQHLLELNPSPQATPTPKK